MIRNLLTLRCDSWPCLVSFLTVTVISVPKAPLGSAHTTLKIYRLLDHVEASNEKVTYSSKLEVLAFVYFISCKRLINESIHRIDITHWYQAHLLWSFYLKYEPIFQLILWALEKLCSEHVYLKLVDELALTC